MSIIKCKNCGNKKNLKEKNNKIVCENCGLMLRKKEYKNTLKRNYDDNKKNTKIKHKTDQTRHDKDLTTKIKDDRLNYLNNKYNVKDTKEKYDIIAIRLAKKILSELKEFINISKVEEKEIIKRIKEYRKKIGKKGNHIEHYVIAIIYVVLTSKKYNKNITFDMIYDEKYLKNKRIIKNKIKELRKKFGYKIKFKNIKDFINLLRFENKQNKIKAKRKAEEIQKKENTSAKKLIYYAFAIKRLIEKEKNYKNERLKEKMNLNEIMINKRKKEIEKYF